MVAVVVVVVAVLGEVVAAEMVNGVVPDSVPQVKVTLTVPAVALLETVVVPVCEVLLPERVTVLKGDAAAVAVELQPVAAKATVPPGATVVGNTLKPNEVTLLLEPP
ncbi:hypothetical protein GXW82_05190 [Streptacidiphilus sp. 4-A2]|nr:hypothetical protein [Streptacidiphilus sp. 4-A2]